MAKKNIYTGELNKHDNWGGPIEKDGVVYDAAAGDSVQNFVKKVLDSKWGCLYDNTKGKIYIFADEESRDIYLEHEEEEEYQYLKLGELDSFSNYRIVIDLDEEKTKPTNAILLGETGNEVAFTVTTYDKDDIQLTEAINVNFTVTRPDGSKTFVTHIVSSGEKDALNVDALLAEGQNTVAINAIGTSSNAVANATVVYQVINLKIDDNHDISHVFDITDGKESTLSLTWGISGTSTTSKFVEWYIDGILQEAPDPIPSGQDVGRITENIVINNELYDGGRHNIQYRAWVNINEKQFYTPTYYKDFIVYNGGSEPIIAVSLTIPTGKEPFIGEEYKNPVAYDVVQYTDYNLPVAVYQNGTLDVNTKLEVLYLDGEEEKVDVSYQSVLSTGEIWNSTIVPTVTGETAIRITAGDGTNITFYNIGALITPLDLNIREEKAGLVLNLRANGKTNASQDRDVWEYHNGSTVYSTAFSGFTWDENSGWNNNELVISEGNSIDINYKPLTSTVKDNGLTFEIEFSTFNVSNDDAVVCEIKNDGPNMPGITITASEAIFSDNAKNVVSTKFKSGENNRITFVVDPTSQGKPLMFIYVNGVACGSASYSLSTSSFAADKTIKIIGTSAAGVKLRHIRIYNIALSSDSILNNYMLYRNSYMEMKNIYDKNDIYATAGVFDLGKISSVLPIMLLTDYDQERNNIQTLMNFTSADKSTPILLRQLQYINNLDPTTNFVVEYAQMTCQGTSSMNYPTKNLRLYIKDKAKGKYGDWTLPITHTGTTMSDVEGTWKSKPGKGKISFKSCLDGTFSEGERKPQEVNCWTLKADYAESSSSHNTGVARLWNEAMRDASLDGNFVSRTRAQAVTMSDPENKMDVRTTVDGFPIVVFYRTSLDDTNWKFLGKYNFNNDKSTESVFGFCDIEGIDYQEYEYLESNEEEYLEALVSYPEDCNETHQNFANVEDYLSFVSGKVEKEISELEYLDYVIALCPTVYEYSKTYQKAVVTIAQEPYDVYYGKKIMTSGDKKNKNYCVEVLENENAVTNFLADVEEFDSGWEDAFEFRYPEVAEDLPDADTKGGLTNLRDFYVWCHSTQMIEDAFETGQEVVINAETKYDGDHLYKRDDDASATYANNGTYIATTFDEFKSLMKKKFEKEKWDYLDVFKMAAYYVYLMRFGGVDQVVKNAMFTSEGTVSYIYKDKQYVESTGNHCKWFYINYDNDTIFGLNNDGQLVYNPLIDRNTRTGEGTWIEYPEPTPEQKAKCKGYYATLDDLKRAVETGEIHPENGDMYLVGEAVYEWSNESGYAYAGHSSVLWNNLENDEEFMTIVSDVDNALFTAGLTYEKALKMFNDKQANMWPERILNKDSQVKYIDNFTQKNLNHLGKMQGPRTSHRTWWLNKRFTYFDSKFISGEYKNKFVLFKADAPQGSENLEFTILPTELMNYGWGITKRANGQTGVPSSKDEEGKFKAMTFKIIDGGMSALGVGDPVEIYAAPYISTLDLSNFASYLMTLDLSGVYNEVLGSQLKTLILGKEGKVNTGASSLKQSDLTNLEKADKLEYLDMQGFENLTSLDISKNPNLREIYAFRSGLLALDVANGSKLEKLSLPECYNTLQLDGVNYLTYNNIVFDKNNVSNLTTIKIKNCDKLKEDSFKLLRKWVGQRDNLANCVVDIQGFDWKISYNEIEIIEAIQHDCESVNLTGKITITDNIEGSTREESIERVRHIKNVFGENCFDSSKNPPIFVNCTIPFVIINADAVEMTAKVGNKINLSCEIYPFRHEDSFVNYYILEGEGYEMRDGATAYTVDNETAIGVLKCEELVVGKASNLTVRCRYNWIGSNDFVSDIKIKVLDPTYPSTIVISGNTSLYKEDEEIYTAYGFAGAAEATGTYSLDWGLTDDEIGKALQYVDEYGVLDENTYQIKTNENQPDSSAKLYLQVTATTYTGESVLSPSVELLVLNENVIMTKESNPVAMRVFYEAGLTDGKEDVMLKSDAEAVTNDDFGTIFAGITSAYTLTENELKHFVKLTELVDGAFSGSTGLSSIELPDRITKLGNYCFAGCTKLSNVKLSDGLSEISEGCFRNCSTLSTIVIPDGVKVLKNYSFIGTAITKIIPKSLSSKSKSMFVPDDIETIEDYTFEENTYSAIKCKLTSIMLPRGLKSLGNNKYILRSSFITEFLVDEDNTVFSSIDGVLYNKTQQTLFKYPCAKLGDIYQPVEACLAISDYAFYNTKLKDITITPNIQTLGIGTFSNSYDLETVNMQSNNAITIIPNETFKGCSKLMNIYWGLAIEGIGSNAIQGCNSITNLVMPDTVKMMSQGAIYGNENLTSFTFPKYMKLPTTYVLRENRNLETITLPLFSVDDDDVEIIYNSTYPTGSNNPIVYSDATKLANLIIPEEDNHKHFIVEDNTIYGVVDNIPTQLVSVPFGKENLFILNTVTSINSSACIFCTKLNNFTIPESVHTIGSQALWGCNKLTEMTIPSGVTKLNISLFFTSTGIEKVVIETSALTDIGGLAFATCPQLSTIIIKSRQLPKISDNTFRGTGVDALERNIYVDPNLVEIYKSDESWKELMTREKPFNFLPIEEQVFSTPSKSNYNNEYYDISELQQRIEALEKLFKNTNL